MPFPVHPLRMLALDLRYSHSAVSVVGVVDTQGKQADHTVALTGFRDHTRRVDSAVNHVLNIREVPPLMGNAVREVGAFAVQLELVALPTHGVAVLAGTPGYGVDLRIGELSYGPVRQLLGRHWIMREAGGPAVPVQDQFAGGRDRSLFGIHSSSLVEQDGSPTTWDSQSPSGCIRR